MNKAFEKILDRLEESYIDCFHQGDYKFNNAIDKAEQIVQEVAEEFATYTNVGTNGWIACSDRLPEEYTVLCCDIYGEMIVAHPYFDEVSNTNYSAESDNEMMYNCVAWQPLPEPYKESED